jgi:hypothetical protein
METAARTGKGRAARLEVSARMRRFFAELKDELDKDTEEFFNRVMEQAKHDGRVSMSAP